jgi:hypothetical protein
MVLSTLLCDPSIRAKERFHMVGISRFLSGMAIHSSADAETGHIGSEAA